MINVKINDYVLSEDMLIESVSVAPPTPKTQYIDIPFADSTLDLSESTGVLAFGRRAISIVAKKKISNRMEWYTLKSQILNKINGKEVKVIINDEAYYYTGRITSVTEEKDGKIWGMTITINADPYKLAVDLTEVSAAVSGSVILNMTNLKKRVQPLVIATAQINVTIGGRTTQVNASSSGETYDDIILEEGNNAVTVAGTGSITFRYRQGGF